MKSRITGLLAIVLLAGPMAANATTVAWLFQGSVTSVTGNGVPSGINAGDAFSFILHFDTSTPVANPAACGTGGIGTTCRHNADPSLFFSDIYVGSAGPFTFTGDVGNNTIIVRNNAALGNDPTPIDGYTFGANSDNGNGENTNFLLGLRGPNNLGLVTDGRVLPTDPPPGLLDLGQNFLQICDSQAGFDCYYADIQATFTSVARVPEPGTLALLGFGLAGLGMTRRRTKN